MSKSAIILPGSAVNWQHPLNRGLVARYKVLPNRIGGGGKVFRDLSGARHATLGQLFGDPPAWRGSAFPNASGEILFGNVAYAQCSTGLSLPGHMTAIIIFRHTAIQANNGFFCDGDLGEGQYVLVSDSNGNVSFMQASSSCLFFGGGGANALTVGPYYHMAVVRTGSAGSWTINLFTNGIADANNPKTITTDPPASPAANLNLATSLGPSIGGCLQGPIVDLTFFNRGLTQTEIVTHFKLAKHQFDPTLLWMKRRVWSPPAGAAPTGNPWHYYTSQAG